MSEIIRKMATAIAQQRILDGFNSCAVGEIDHGPFTSVDLRFAIAAYHALSDKFGLTNE